MTPESLQMMGQPRDTFQFGCGEDRELDVKSRQPLETRCVCEGSLGLPRCLLVVSVWKRNASDIHASEKARHRGHATVLDVTVRSMLVNVVPFYAAQ